MPPVTCYICGRDFGSRSIGIHLPSCQKKWDNQQEKLPKAQRRPLPQAPENFDKVISGEIKGKELVKMNQKAFDDYNECALQACKWCGRTFMPSSLVHHQKACTEERPLVKQRAGYQSQMKARVKYPTSKKEVKKITEKKSADGPYENTAIEPANGNTVPVPVPVLVPVPNDCESLEEVKPNKQPNDKDQNNQQKGINHHKASSQVLSNGVQPQHDLEKAAQNETRKIGSAKTLTKDRYPQTSPTREEIISFIENESVFDSAEHRMNVMIKLTNYVRDVKRSNLLELLHNEVFDEEDNIMEIVKMLEEYIIEKSSKQQNTQNM